AAGVNEGSGSRVLRKGYHCVTLAHRPGGSKQDLRQHHGRHARNYRFGFHGLFLARFAIVYPHGGRTMFDLRDWAFEANSVTEPRSKRIRHPLVSTPEAKNFRRK